MSGEIAKLRQEVGDYVKESDAAGGFSVAPLSQDKSRWVFDKVSSILELRTQLHDSLARAPELDELDAYFKTNLIHFLVANPLRRELALEYRIANTPDIGEEPDWKSLYWLFERNGCDLRALAGYALDNGGGMQKLDLLHLHQCEECFDFYDTWCRLVRDDVSAKLHTEEIASLRGELQSEAASGGGLLFARPYVGCDGCVRIEAPIADGRARATLRYDNGVIECGPATVREYVPGKPVARFRLWLWDSEFVLEQAGNDCFALSTIKSHFSVE